MSASCHSAALLPIHLTYLPAQPLLAEAVPEDEGDYPCTSRRSVIRNQSKGLACGVSMVEVSFENYSLRDPTKFAFGGSHFLHINTRVPTVESFVQR